MDGKGYTARLAEAEEEAARLSTAERMHVMMVTAGILLASFFVLSVLSFRRVCRSPLSVLVHLWFAVLFEEVCPITTLGWRVCGSVLLFEEVCPITTLGWRVCGSVLFFHSRLARLWFDLCPNGPVGRVASLPDATRPCAGQVQIGIFRACGRGRRVSDCLCF